MSELKLYHCEYAEGPWSTINWIFTADCLDNAKVKVREKLGDQFKGYPDKYKRVDAIMIDSKRLEIIEHPIDAIVETLDIE